jgi:hypothetical protein
MIFDPFLIVALMMAAVVGFALPPHLELASPRAARAMRLGAAALAFWMLMPMGRLLGMNWYEFQGIVGPLLQAGFWGSFGYAAWALVMSARAKEVP